MDMKCTVHSVTQSLSSSSFSSSSSSSPSYFGTMSLCLFYYWSALFGALAIAPDLKWKLEMHSHLFASLGTFLLFLFSLAFKPPAVCNDTNTHSNDQSRKWDLHFNVLWLSPTLVSQFQRGLRQGQPSYDCSSQNVTEW